MARSNYTDDQFTEFAKRDIVFGTYSSMDIYETNPTWQESFFGQFISCYYSTDRAEEHVQAQCRIFHTLQRFQHEGKKLIGLINGDNADGSYNISILGDDYNFNVNTAPIISIHEVATSTGRIEDDKCVGMTPYVIWGNTGIVETIDYGRHYEDINNEEAFDPPYDIYDFTPRWHTGDVPPFYGLFSEFNGVGSTSTSATVSRDKTATFNVGVAKSYPFLSGPLFEYLPFLSDEVYQRIAGDMIEMCDMQASVVGTAIEGTPSPGWASSTDYFPIPGVVKNVWDGADIEVGRHWFAGYFKPYNLILTHDEDQAIEYLKTGRIPNDAEIYPWNPDEFPKYKDPSDTGDDEGEGDDEPNESDDPDKNPSYFDDMPDGNPDYTPSKLQNNNLYWLTGQELSDFINWFWTDAGEVADLESLWQKIQGLFNDLASSIINIRYMPVNINYVGGVVPTNNIIVGMIAYSPASSIYKIVRGNPSLVTLGSIEIKEVIEELKTAKGFTNYSPYAQCSLYLPFYGFLDLDNDMLMGSTLTVKAIYDIITGTMQYFIYRTEGGKQQLINAIPCKMAVDIPITLQSKGDRDSAIFQNVANVGGSALTGLIGAATGNPIGVVMGVSNFASGVANAGSQSAPMSVKGSIQESGSFYAPTKCALYIQRPIYNRPKIYKSRLGYPCNKGYTLNSDSISGYTVCESPRITFKNSTPMQEEIDEIYDYLTKGVIV